MPIKNRSNLLQTKFDSQKRLIASQLKPRKGRDIKWILIENTEYIFLVFEKLKLRSPLTLYQWVSYIEKGVNSLFPTFTQMFPTFFTI